MSSHLAEMPRTLRTASSLLGSGAIPRPGLQVLTELSLAASTILLWHPSAHCRGYLNMVSAGPPVSQSVVIDKGHRVRDTVLNRVQGHSVSVAKLAIPSISVKKF